MCNFTSFLIYSYSLLAYAMNTCHACRYPCQYTVFCPHRNQMFRFNSQYTMWHTMSKCKWMNIICARVTHLKRMQTKFPDLGFHFLIHLLPCWHRCQCIQIIHMVEGLSWITTCLGEDMLIFVQQFEDDCIGFI